VVVVPVRQADISVKQIDKQQADVAWLLVFLEALLTMQVAVQEVVTNLVVSVTMVVRLRLVDRAAVEPEAAQVQTAELEQLIPEAVAVVDIIAVRTFLAVVDQE
jgi:hypothetical protein